MKVKISHEVPLAVLNISQTFNDYDYCLPHLLDSEYEYFKYFDQAKKDEFPTLEQSQADVYA